MCTRMSGFYPSMQDVANELLTEFGSDWIVRRVGNTPYNPATNDLFNTIKDEVTIKAVRQNYKNAQINGESILAGDILLLVDSKALEIGLMPTDKMVNNDEVWQIINIELIKPADVVLFYKVQLRK